MATATKNDRDRGVAKVDSQPAVEKPGDVQDEFEPTRGFDDDENTKKLTKRLLWKLDTRYTFSSFLQSVIRLIFWSRILPVLAILFLCSFLDRTNVGNAKILGLEDDVGLNNSQYANGLAIFFAFYIAAELPSNLVLKKASPRIWLAFLTAAWGIIGMCLGFVHNYAGFLIVRAFLGIAEGGLLPGMVLYLSGMYTR
ncbi:hypothetical protein LTS06_012473, partial [Exophiala xenobiotica]